MFSINRKACIFDFDDTLVETTVYFDIAKSKFAQIMFELDFPVAEALVTLNDFDIKNVCRMGGFYKECFPKALVQTYQYYCRLFNRKEDEKLKEKIENLGWWVFAQEPKIIEGSHEVLEELSYKYHLFLATKGDPQIQMERVKKSGLADFFEHIYVLKDKTSIEFEDIARKQGLDVSKSWVIGNSMKGDINPSIIAGFNSIYVYHHHTWDFEEEEPIGGHIDASSIREVPKIILGAK